MKRILSILSTTIAICVAGLLAFAADEHNHKHAATPNGGRLLDKTEPHAEFVVEKDRTVSIHFLTEDMKPVAATTQTVTVIADPKTGKQTIPFEKKGDLLVSKSPLPEGDGYMVIVQFRQTPDAKPQNLRFKLAMEVCAECKRAEYACVCEH